MRKYDDILNHYDSIYDNSVFVLEIEPDLSFCFRVR